MDLPKRPLKLDENAEFQSSPSSSSSRNSSTVISCDYEYDPNDFPKENEIEEFESPSFCWPSSPSVSTSSERSARPVSIRHDKKWPQTLVTKQTTMEHLAILLSLSRIVVGGAAYDNYTRMEVIAEAQETLDKAIGKAINIQYRDRNKITEQLETAVTKIFGLLVPIKG